MPFFIFELAKQNLALFCSVVTGIVLELKMFTILTRMLRGNDDNIDHIKRRNLRFLQRPHWAVYCLQHLRSSGLGTIVCKSNAAH